MSKAHSQLARFAAVGVVGFVVDAGILWIALRAGLGYFAGRAVSFLGAVLATWLINRRFTFQTNARGSLWTEWWRYLSAMSLGGCINYAAYSAVVFAAPHMPALPFLAVGAGSLAGLAVNFASAKWWVFRQRQSS